MGHIQHRCTKGHGNYGRQRHGQAMGSVQPQVQPQQCSDHSQAEHQARARRQQRQPQGQHQPSAHQLEYIKATGVVWYRYGIAIHQCGQHVGMGLYAGVNQADWRDANILQPWGRGSDQHHFVGHSAFCKTAFDHIAGRNVLV